MNTVIQLQDIHKTYHTGDVDVQAVRGVSLAVSPGEFVALMGASGSGKSTMMNIIGCLDRPTKGKYLLDGIDVSELSRDQLADIRNQKIGFVFQGFNLLARTTALENVELPMLYARQRLDGQNQREQALKALDIVGLGERADHKPNQLSGGQQQRVAIASVLAMRPEVMVLDEPTSFLDPLSARRIFEVIHDLNRNLGITVVLVEHRLDLTARYANHIIIMDKGRVLLDGDPHEILKSEQTRLVGVGIPKATRLYQMLTKDGARLGKTVPLSSDEMTNLLEEVFEDRR